MPCQSVSDRITDQIGEFNRGRQPASYSNHRLNYGRATSAASAMQANA
jgi:hypothetical protein